MGGPQPARLAEEVQVSETVLLILNLFENQQILYEFELSAKLPQTSGRDLTL